MLGGGVLYGRCSSCCGTLSVLMYWIWWATIGYFLNAVAISIDKALLKRKALGNPAVYTIIISSLGLLVLVLAPFGLTPPTVQSLTFGILSGAFFTLGLWTMFIVLQRGEASRVPAFIGSLNPLFVFLGSFLLMGERLGGQGFVAFIFLVAGGFCMVGGAGGLDSRSRWLAAASAAAYGVAYVLLKVTFTDSNFVSGLVWSRLGGFIAALALLWVPGTFAGLRRSSGGSAGPKVALLSGQALASVGGLLNSYAITLASVTLVNALQGIQYVFLLGLAALVSFRWPQLFHDEFSGRVLVRKVAGCVFILVGLALLGNLG